MGTSPVENRLVDVMERWLRQHDFLTKIELQLTSKYLDIPTLTRSIRPQQQIRIDLAALSLNDHSYHFIEAESDLQVFHPTLYVNFAHFTYLLCPQESLSRHESDHVAQQFRYAREWGIGILTIDRKENIKVHVHPRRCKPAPEVITVLDHLFGKATMR